MWGLHWFHYADVQNKTKQKDKNYSMKRTDGAKYRKSGSSRI